LGRRQTMSGGGPRGGHRGRGRCRLCAGCGCTVPRQTGAFRRSEYHDQQRQQHQRCRQREESRAVGVAAPTAASASDTNRGAPFRGKVYEPLGLARRARTHVALNRSVHFRAEPPKMIVQQMLAHCLMAQLGFRSSLGPSCHVMPLRARSRLILAGRCEVRCQRNSIERTCQAATLMVTAW
jgi:hypothetical protein